MDAKNINDLIALKNKEIIKSLPKKALSVSKCLGYIKEEFDKEGKAKGCVEKYFDDSTSPYYHMTAEEIVKRWTDKADLSKHYGSLLDDYIGMVLNNETDTLEKWKGIHGYDYDNRLKSICTGFDQFYKVLTSTTDYQYLTREQNMYIVSQKSGNGIRGRFDCLFYSPSLDSYLIVDWKTTEKIPSKGFNGAKMFGPCYDLDDCHHNEYTLQTQFYKKALCESYGITTYDKVSCMICQMLVAPADNRYFHLYKENTVFNTERLDNVIDWGFKCNEEKAA